MLSLSSESKRSFIQGLASSSSTVAGGVVMVASTHVSPTLSAMCAIATLGLALSNLKVLSNADGNRNSYEAATIGIVMGFISSIGVTLTALEYSVSQPEFINKAEGVVKDLSVPSLTRGIKP